MANDSTGRPEYHISGINRKLTNPLQIMSGDKETILLPLNSHNLEGN